MYVFRFLAYFIVFIFFNSLRTVFISILDTWIPRIYLTKPERASLSSELSEGRQSNTWTGCSARRAAPHRRSTRRRGSAATGMTGDRESTSFALTSSDWRFWATRTSIARGWRASTRLWTTSGWDSRTCWGSSSHGLSRWLPRSLVASLTSVVFARRTAPITSGRTYCKALR